MLLLTRNLTRRSGSALLAAASARRAPLGMRALLSSSASAGSGGAHAGAAFVSPALLAAVTAATATASATSFLALQAGAGDSVDYGAVRKAVADALAKEEERREDGTSMAGTLLRLAWHAAGTYSKSSGNGGSDGATMRFGPEAADGANAGLHHARNFLEPIKAQFPGISYADLWTLAGVVAIEEMGGPSIPWRPGRTDASSAAACPPNGRLPDADKGSPPATAQHVREVFGRMGFSDREMVALIGAHAVGRCHTDASGYWGPWTNSEVTFSNEFYRLLLEEKWTPKRTHEGKPWRGPDQYENPDGRLMMLPADLVLVQDPEFRKYVEMYAKDEDLWFRDFSAAFGTLIELGCKNLQGGPASGGSGGGGCGIIGWFCSLFGGKCK